MIVRSYSRYNSETRRSPYTPRCMPGPARVAQNIWSSLTGFVPWIRHGEILKLKVDSWKWLVCR